MSNFIIANYNFILFLYGIILIFSAIASFTTYKIEAKKPRIIYTFLIFLGFFGFFLGLEKWLNILEADKLLNPRLTDVSRLFGALAYLCLLITSFYFTATEIWLYKNRLIAKKSIFFINLLIGLIIIIALIAGLLTQQIECSFRLIAGACGAFILAVCFFRVTGYFLRQKNSSAKDKIYHFLSGLLFLLYGLTLLFCEKNNTFPGQWLSDDLFFSIFHLPIYFIRFCLILLLNIFMLRLIIYLEKNTTEEKKNIQKIKIKHLNRLLAVMVLIIIISFPVTNLAKNFSAQRIQMEIKTYFEGITSTISADEFTDFNNSTKNNQLADKIALIKKSFKHGQIYKITIIKSENNLLYSYNEQTDNWQPSNLSTDELLKDYNNLKIFFQLHKDKNGATIFDTTVPIKDELGGNIALIKITHNFAYYDTALYYLELLFFILITFSLIIACVIIYLFYVKEINWQKIASINEQLDQIVEERTQKLKKALKELQSLDELKDEFLNITAHELKTPLTSIIALTEILLFKKQDSLSVSQKKNLKIVNTEAIRLLNIIKKILDITRIEANKMSFQLQKTDLNPIIADVVKSLRPLADKLKVKIMFNEHNKDLLVKADAERIHEVIYNLLNNAIKFSAANDTITISSKIDGSDHLIASVKDQGPGIPIEEQKKLFHKFAQLDTGYNRKQEGTGLGLYISKIIVENMRGKIWVESKPGQGATFYFSLPIYKEKI